MVDRVAEDLGEGLLALAGDSRLDADEHGLLLAARGEDRGPVGIVAHISVKRRQSVRKGRLRRTKKGLILIVILHNSQVKR